MEILKLKLRSDLCAGSGEATGMTVDNDLCMDEYGLPYIPARRLKGVLRATAEELKECGAVKEEQILKLFGTGKEPGLFRLSDAVLPGAAEMRNYLKGELPDELKEAAAPLHVAALFTSVRGQTSMEDGVAKDGTLRSIRVLEHYNALHPEEETELVAEVSFSKGADTELFERCCKATRHMGSNRNRGLGYVSLTFETAADNRKMIAPPSLESVEGETLEITYTLSLDAPVTLPGCTEQFSEIPARSVIGCLAALVEEKETEEFSDLFLNGAVCWSSLTPCVEKKRSIPAPLSLVEFKCEKTNQDEKSDQDKKIYKNRLKVEDEPEKKFSTVEGMYLSENLLVRPQMHTLYHHSNMGGELYMQDSLDAGMLYAGRVIAPRHRAEKVLELLCKARFSFGRSKTAQYGGCTLIETPKVQAYKEKKLLVKEDEPVWVLFESDLVLTREGIYDVSPEAVRQALAKKLGLKNECNGLDCCRYRTLSGYHAMWGLQKPQIPALCGGSIFAFRAQGGEVKARGFLGEFPQEGFGAFRVLEMENLGNAQEGKIDRHVSGTGREPEALRRAMAEAELERRCAAAVSEYFHSGEYEKLRIGILNRVRDMVEEAESFDELLSNIDSIKTSDQHSDNPEPDKNKAKALLNKVRERTYGKNKELIELLSKKEDPAGWKKPLRQMIHLMYYGKEERHD